MSLLAAAVALGGLGWAVPSTAQPVRAPASPPGWRARQLLLNNFTTSQRTAVMARLEKIEQILLKVPALARPQGFEVWPTFHGGARRLWPDARGRPNEVTGDLIEHRLRLLFILPGNHEGTDCLSVIVNWVGNPGGMSLFDPQGRQIYAEMTRGDALPGATQVYERLSPTERGFTYVLLTPGQALPWKTVSREEYYRAWIFEAEGPGGAKLAEVRAKFANTPYEQWLEGTEERRRNREVALAAAAQSQTPEQVAAMRKTLEDTEREVTERLKAQDPADREEYSQAIAAAAARPNAMRAELERMTPAERSLPAMIDRTLSEGSEATGLRLADRDGPNVWRVLTPDRDFWRARRSPVEARGIMVQLSTGLSCASPAVHRAIWQTWQQLDWAALAALLEPEL